MGVRFDRGGEIGVAGRPLSVDDRERRRRQRGAAATERRGLRGFATIGRALRGVGAVRVPRERPRFRRRCFLAAGSIILTTSKDLFDRRECKSLRTLFRSSLYVFCEDSSTSSVCGTSLLARYAHVEGNHRGGDTLGIVKLHSTQFTSRSNYPQRKRNPRAICLPPRGVPDAFVRWRRDGGRALTTGSKAQARLEWCVRCVAG